MVRLFSCEMQRPSAQESTCINLFAGQASKDDYISWCNQATENIYERTQEYRK